MSGIALLARDLRVRPGGGAGDGDFVLAVDELVLREGEALAVLGPNGAGKSTLLRALAGLERPERGVVDTMARGPVALVFQRPVMLAGTVAWNVALPLWGAGMPRASRAQRVARELRRFGLSSLADRRALTLSGGETRRAALAQAFVREPAALLLDEPFDDLDAAAQESLSLELRAAIRATGVAVALVTHDLRHALLLADRIAVLQAGRIVQCDARDRVLERPVSATVARLVGMSNLLPGRVIARDGDGGAVVEIGPDARVLAEASRAVGTRVLVGIRPEHVKIDVGRGETTVVGKGVVRRTLSDGALVTAWIEWGGCEVRAVAVAGRGLGRALGEGDRVSLAVRPQDVRLLEPEGAAQ